MALKPACDVFGRTKGVRKYRVVIQEVDPESLGSISEAAFERVLDLCPSALDRAVSFAEKGAHPVRWKPEPAEEKAAANVEDAT